MSLKTYRQQFAAIDKAREYESGEYGPGSYGQLLWHIEQQQLASLVRNFRASHNRIDYLDFACGTGRVISFMQNKVDNVTGIEISEAMADIGRAKLQRGLIHSHDITDGSFPIEGTYDFITAFRFFLNAEPSLRVASMKALANRLKDQTSYLVFNNHGNLLSHKMLLWPFHSLRRIRTDDHRQGNYMTDGQVRRLVHAAGLRIVHVVGCGVLGAKVAKLMSFDRALAQELRLASSFLSRLGVNQMYVAQRASLIRSS